MHTSRPQKESQRARLTKRNCRSTGDSYHPPVAGTTSERRLLLNDAVVPPLCPCTHPGHNVPVDAIGPHPDLKSTLDWFQREVLL